MFESSLTVEQFVIRLCFREIYCFPRVCL